MPTRLESIVIDAADPSALARWWAEALGWPIVHEEPDEVVVEIEGGTPWAEGGQPPLVFGAGVDAKVGKNRVHIDLGASTQEEHDRLLAHVRAIGAREVDIGQGNVPWTVFADPDGNEFCVLEPHDMYAGVGPIVAVVLDCSDPQRVAPFWEAATGWSGAVDNDGDVRLRAPGGGPTLDLLAVPDEKVGKLRWHIDVAPFENDAQGDEVARLETLGGRRVDIGQGDVTWVVLADPEGNELCVLSCR